MSKKYVPSFLKNGGGGNESNQFAALSDDFQMLKNTSLPAKEAPKMAPATLASLTSNGAGSGSGSGSGGNKKSFAAKFAEQTKISADPNYVPPPKAVDVTSTDDFPSLGAPKKTVAKAWGGVEKSFADKAKEWAKKKEDEEIEAKCKAERREKMRQEEEQLKRLSHQPRRVKGITYNDDDEEELFNPKYTDDQWEDSDSYVPSNEEDELEPSEEEDDEDAEFNPNVGWDGRRRGDLY